MKLIPSSFLTGSKAGFSLIEVQVVVAIVALLAAIVVPQVPRITAHARSAKGQSNAQNLASVASAANAAGVQFGSLDAALAEMVRPGGVVSSTGLRWGVPSLSAAEVDAAKQYLGFSNGQVVYLSN